MSVCSTPFLHQRRNPGNPAQTLIVPRRGPGSDGIVPVGVA